MIYQPESEIAIVERTIGGFSDDFIISAIAIFGFTGLSFLMRMNRRYFAEALILFLIAMIYNKALKYTFNIPLPPEFGPDKYALPSGHTQAALAFYGWIAVRYKSKLVTIFSALIVLGVITSLLYFQYHVMADILAALLFGLILMGSYYFCFRKFSSDTMKSIVFIFTSFLIFYIYSIHGHKISNEMWCAYILSNLLFQQLERIPSQVLYFTTIKPSKIKKKK